MDRVERLNVQNSLQWEELNIELPDTISFACNLLTQALWPTKTVALKFPALRNDVLLVGGGQKEIFRFNTERNDIKKLQNN